MGTQKKYYVAQEKQRLFHVSSADETLYGGAAGGGKSYAIIWDAVIFCMKNNHARTTIFRRKFPELEKSIISEFLEKVPSKWYEYNKKEHRAYFNETKSTLEFNHCQYNSDTKNYQSAQYDRMYFDELTHFTEYIYAYLHSRCRTTKKNMQQPQVKSATNPGGIGHQWVKKRFVDGANLNVPTTRLDERTNNRYTTLYIPAKVYDNKYIMENDPNYISRLLKLPDAERKALLEGDWYSFEGQYFNEWDYDVHVIKPFKIPDYWGRIRAMDWGYSKPTVVLWIAFDPETKDAYVYKELTLVETTIEQVAYEILALSKDEKIHYTAADPSIWSVTQYEKGTSIAHKLIQAGVPLIKADNHRVAGWNQIHSYLYHSKKDAIKPKLRFFNNCYDTIRTLPDLIHDQHKPEDLDTGGEDHHADALRYGLMTRPIIGKKDIVKAPYKSFDYWLNKEEQEKALKSYVGRF